MIHNVDKFNSAASVIFLVFFASYWLQNRIGGHIILQLAWLSCILVTKQCQKKRKEKENSCFVMNIYEISSSACRLNRTGSLLLWFWTGSSCGFLPLPPSLVPWVSLPRHQCFMTLAPHWAVVTDNLPRQMLLFLYLLDVSFTYYTKHLFDTTTFLIQKRKNTPLTKRL